MSTVPRHRTRRPAILVPAVAMLCGAVAVVPVPPAAAGPAPGMVAAVAPLASSPVFVPRAWTLGKDAGTSRTSFYPGPGGGSWTARIYSVSRVDYATPRVGSRVTYPLVGRTFLLHATVGVVFPADVPDVFALSMTMPAGVRTAISATNPMRCYVTNLNAVPIRRVPATQCRQRPAVSGRTVTLTAQRITRGQAVHVFLPVVSTVAKGGVADPAATVRFTAVLRLKMAVPTTVVATSRIRVRRAG